MIRKPLCFFSFFIVMLISGASFASAQTSCLGFQSGSVPLSGVDSFGRSWSYGASWDVYDPLKPLLIKTNCPTSGTKLTLTVGKGDVSQLVYSVSWAYSSGWHPYTLSGTAATFAQYLAGVGTTTIAAPATASASSPFYFVGYVCQLHASSWKCGCSDTSCTTGKWQLQTYTGVSGGGITGGIRGATAKVFLVPHSCCTGPIASLSGVSDISTKYIYIPPSQNAVSSGDSLVFDHSLGGIDAGAQKAVDLIVSRSDGWKNNAALLDFESLKSINVPSEFLPYDPATQDDWVVWYRTNVPDNLRMAAVRFNKLMFDSMHKKLTALGHGSFELGAWGFPNKMKWGDTYAEMQASTNRAKSETLNSVITPYLSYGAPSVYFSFTPSMATAIRNGTLTRDEVIDWLVNSAKAARAAYPPEFKILPIMWPYCYGTCPFDSLVVPPGYMRELAERLLDEARVDGFSVWRSSADDDFGAAGDALFSARWQEVVDVIHERGTFRTAH